MHARAPDPAPPPLDALRRLEPAAVEQVYDAYSARLNGFLRRMGASVEVAEELVQEAFVRLVRAAPRLADDTRVGAWLYTVTRNLWVSHRRWSWVDGSRLLALATAPRSRPPTPADQHGATEAQARIERAVAALPEVQREVFLLVVGEDLEPAEAAAVLGITAEAARQRLSRARRAVEEALS